MWLAGEVICLGLFPRYYHIFSALPYERIEIHHLLIILWLDVIKGFHIAYVLLNVIYHRGCWSENAYFDIDCACFVRSMTLLHLFKTNTAFWQCNFGFSHAHALMLSQVKVQCGRRFFRDGRFFLLGSLSFLHHRLLCLQVLHLNCSLVED